MRFVDTNVFLRYLTRDDEKKARDVFSLMRRLERNEEKAATSSLVIFETVFTLDRYYGVPRKEIKQLLYLILGLRGLKLDFREVFEAALELYSETTLSFADAFNACFMRSRGIAEIYSFDEDFERVEGLRRVVPE